MMVFNAEYFGHKTLCDSCKQATCCDSIDSLTVFDSDVQKLTKIGKGGSKYLQTVKIKEKAILTTIKKKENSSECVFFDSKKKLCTIYENRPFDCRMYPFDVTFIDNEPWWIVYSCNPNSNWKWTEEYLQKIEKHPQFKEIADKLDDYRLYVENKLDDRSKVEIPVRKVNFHNLH